MQFLFLVIISLVSPQLIAAPVGDCEGTPSSAIIELPKPLASWGGIACTPYGHIITNKDGWVWSNPGGYSPVMIPSQMIRSNPETLGNRSFFTKIKMTTLSGNEATSSIMLFETGLDSTDTLPKVYSLEVVSVSGKKLGFQFFDYGASQWGMRCNGECNPQSKFMLLNMSKQPNK